MNMEAQGDLSNTAAQDFNVFIKIYTNLIIFNNFIKLILKLVTFKN